MQANPSDRFDAFLFLLLLARPVRGGNDVTVWSQWMLLMCFRFVERSAWPLSLGPVHR